MDVYCKVCGEPWDAYGVFHGDMTVEERKMFLDGKGCPCCKGIHDGEDAMTEDEFFTKTLMRLFL
ncbi:MAG: hypothetical protein ACTSUO_06005 [Candidatus Thorarchaeota archaeon]